MQDNKDIISVVISAYNAEKTIWETLESLENQDFDHKRFEVIIVDDGSIDTTKDIIQYYIDNGDISISYYFQENHWVGIARNHGITKASGNIIAFTDADCICDKDWLSVIFKEIRNEWKKLIGGTIYSHDTIIYPWKMAPAGHFWVTANLAFERTDYHWEYFSRDFRWMIWEDTDFIMRLNRQWIPLLHVSKMRVLHKANILSFRRIYTRAKWRMNEVLLYKTYWESVLNSFSPIFRPIIFGRISIFSLGIIFITIIWTELYIQFGFLALMSYLFGSFLAFYIYFYKFLIIYAPTENPILNPSEKIRSFINFVFIIPLYFYFRIKGSLKYRFFML